MAQMAARISMPPRGHGGADPVAALVLDPLDRLLAGKLVLTGRGIRSSARVPLIDRV